MVGGRVNWNCREVGKTGAALIFVTKTRLQDATRSTIVLKVLLTRQFLRLEQLRAIYNEKKKKWVKLLISDVYKYSVWKLLIIPNRVGVRVLLYFDARVFWRAISDLDHRN